MAESAGPTGLIADIQRSSVHDGPGLRTTVFFKGCPLHCAWCHNPECIGFAPETLHYPDKCIGCGRCADGCFAGARVTCGREMTVAEILREVRQDKPYYGQDGGVTLSGGEPLAQPDFALALADACRSEGIGCAIETSLYASWSVARPVLAGCRLVMADLKLLDDNRHQALTGVSNRLILDNLRRLDQLGLPIILRTPVLAGVNDGEINAIAAFAATLRNLLYYELLPYHPLGLGKADALNRPEARFAAPDPAELKSAARLTAQAAGIPIRIAGGIVEPC